MILNRLQTKRYINWIMGDILAEDDRVDRLERERWRKLRAGEIEEATIIHKYFGIRSLSKAYYERKKKP